MKKIIIILLIPIINSCIPQTTPTPCSTCVIDIFTSQGTISTTSELITTTTQQIIPVSTTIIPFLSETPTPTSTLFPLETTTITMTERKINNCNIENSGWNGVIKSNIEYLEDVWVTFGVENCTIVSWKIVIWYEPAQYYLIVEDSQIPIEENNFYFDESNQPRGVVIDGWFNTKKTCYGHIGIPKGYSTETWPEEDVLIVDWFATKV